MCTCQGPTLKWDLQSLCNPKVDRCACVNLFRYDVSDSCSFLKIVCRLHLMKHKLQTQSWIKESHTPPQKSEFKAFWTLFLFYLLSKSKSSIVVSIKAVCQNLHQRNSLYPESLMSMTLPLMSFSSSPFKVKESALFVVISKTGLDQRPLITIVFFISNHQKITHIGTFFNVI